MSAKNCALGTSHTCASYIFWMILCLLKNGGPPLGPKYAPPPFPSPPPRLTISAARSPKAVLSYFGADVKGTPTVQATVNTDALQPNQQEAKAPSNMLWGATNKEQVAFLRQIKAEVNKQFEQA